MVFSSMGRPSTALLSSRCPPATSGFAGSTATSSGTIRAPGARAAICLDVGFSLGHLRVADLGHLQPAERARRVGPDDQLVGLQVALVGVGHVGGGDDDDRDRDAEGEGDRAEGGGRA